MNKLELIQRLQKWSMPEPNSGCWIWLGTTRNDYGLISVDNRSRSAHRIAFECHCGPIPKGMDVCHRCDTPCCVNPDHLFLGTHSDNMRDMFAKNRGNSMRGERHYAARLTPELVKKIRSSTVPVRTLARELGVSRHAVRAAKRGDTWKDIPMPELRLYNYPGAA